MNGVPIAGYSLNNANTNLLTGTVSPAQSSNFVEPGGPTNYTFNPVTVGTATTSPNNHPTLTLSGYVGGVMVTASGGATARQRISRRPMSSPTSRIALATSASFCPAARARCSLSSMSRAAPQRASAGRGHVELQLYLRKPERPNGLNGLNGARGTYVNPSNFAARAAAVYDNGANIPVSLRSGGLAAPSARRLRQSADGYG